MAFATAYKLKYGKYTASSYILVVFSACGGISIGNSMPILTAYFPVLAQDLGKGCLVRGTTTRILPYWVLPELRQVVPTYSLSVEEWPT